MPFAEHPNLWLMLGVAQWINWPDTLAAAIGTPHAWPVDDSFKPDALAAVMQQRQDNGQQVYIAQRAYGNARPTGSSPSDQTVALALREQCPDHRRVVDAFRHLANRAESPRTDQMLLPKQLPPARTGTDNYSARIPRR